MFSSYWDLESTALVKMTYCTQQEIFNLSAKLYSVWVERIQVHKPNGLQDPVSAQTLP